MIYESPESIFEEIRSLVPAYAGITYDRLDIAGLQWPCPDIDHPGTPFLHQKGFPRGKGLLQGLEFQYIDPEIRCAGILHAA
jgi:predicted molibdopterin-dependent oxidoreductase YjgC